ncbi:TRAP transporter permease [Vallitalea okinawensis]|uniref:TRAP transporter permease n=1 Tax=Vallitalea okinawensis TaxID=2078660 RepID=UPI000CFD4711|nr:TRAP transporter permease [Vallitalea okinawensis]
MEEKINNDVEVDLDQVKEMDKESNYRKLVGWAGGVILSISVAMSLFQLYTSGFGLLQARLQRSIHLAFAMSLIFLLFPATKKSPKNKFTIVDVLFAIVGVVVNLYIVFNFESLAYRSGAPTTMDIIMAVLAVIVVLEAGRRVIGIDLPILGVIFLAYAYLGPYLPFLAHRGYSINRIAEYMYLTLEGIYSTPLAVAATYVFLFVLFGVLAEKTGLGQLFIDIAMAVAGKSTGGPAKVSVISSGLMGSINGSSIANTVTTGAFTIPLMKKMGYQPRFAGAVEAAASTGGQIMPPIMGAAAFIMAEFLGISYSTIIFAAIIPALLYYLAVGTMVHLEAAKHDLKGLERVPHIFNILKERGYLLVPLVVIIWQLVGGFTPLSAGFYGSLSAMIIYFIELLIVSRKEGLDLIKGIKMWLMDMRDCLSKGAISSLGVTASCAAVGFIVGTCTLTGLGLTFANKTISLAQTIVDFFAGIGLTFMATPSVHLFFTLVFTMIACTILGSGIPTTATYIILAMIAAPAIESLGVNPLAAHLFVLYFGVVADLTPPVALAAYAGAGIAGSNPFLTGFTAVKLALAGFVVPFIFVYNPVLLLQDVVLVEAIIPITTAVIGIIAMGAGAVGYLKTNAGIIERVLLFLSAFLLLIPGWKSDLAGIFLLLLIFTYQMMKKKKEVIIDMV